MKAANFENVYFFHVQYSVVPFLHSRITVMLSYLVQYSIVQCRYIQPHKSFIVVVYFPVRFFYCCLIFVGNNNASLQLHGIYTVQQSHK